MNKQVDLAIIGTGTAATVTALRAVDAGWRVAVVDDHRFGGTCALRGCDPKKILVDAAAGVDHVRRMQGKGVGGAVQIDWTQLMMFKRAFTEPVPEKKERLYADKGIATYHGQARFTGKNTLDIDGETVEAKYILIAAGAQAARLGIPGEEYLADNEGFLTLDRLPKRIVIVGGGYIAAEFSHVAARAGAQVTILQHANQMLTQFDPELVDWLMPAFQSIGIDVHTRTSVKAVEKIGTAYRVLAAKGDQQIVFDADLVVHAAGRKPALDALNLPAGDVALEDGRLRLNDYLQSVTNPCVYAAGDAAQMGPPLTPVSTHDAKVVAANILQGNHCKPDYRGVPSVAFTIPPIASVGMSEAQARKDYPNLRMKSDNASDWFTARHTAQAVYGFKVLVDADSDRILGAHLVGPHADEVINLFALAIRHELSAEQLKTTMFAYPTAASDIGHML